MRQQNKQPIKHYADAAEMGNIHRMISKPVVKGSKTATEMCRGIDL